MKPLFNKNKMQAQKMPAKKLYDKNIASIIDTNNALNQIISLVLNNCADALNEYNPQIIKELETGKKHLDNLSFLLSRMQS